MQTASEHSTATGSLSIYLSEINRHALLTQPEEQKLARRFRKGDLQAGHRLVTANLRFVVKVAYEYRSYGLRMPDLIQEGNIGLMKAVQKFDPDKGIRLISYAVWWIRAYVQNHILKSWSLVKLGTTQAQRKLFFSLARTRREMERLGAGETRHPGGGDCRPPPGQALRGAGDGAAHRRAGPLARCPDGRGREQLPPRLHRLRRGGAGGGGGREAGGGRAHRRPGAHAPFSGSTPASASSSSSG